MNIDDILQPSSVLCRCTAQSKKSLLQQISHIFVQSNESLDEAELFDAFFARERLGSTAMGHGFAIPHIRVAQSHVPMGAFIHLEKGIDFDAADSRKVDLVFAIIAPTDQDTTHLNLLAEISRRFIDGAFRAQLRQARSDSELYQTLVSPYHEPAAIA